MWPVSERVGAASDHGGNRVLWTPVDISRNPMWTPPNIFPPIEGWPVEGDAHFQGLPVEGSQRYWPPALPLPPPPVEARPANLFTHMLTPC